MPSIRLPLTTLAFAPFLAITLCVAGAAHAQAPERKQVTLAVGGKNSLYYLPLTICERLGYFKEQGLDVTINDFRGGAQSLQALVGGSVDVVTGAYEHTIRMQAKGQDIRAVIELGRFPGIAVGLRKEKAAGYKSAADLKGMKIGVSAPGSSTNFFVMYMMSKAGLKPTDASYIGIGIGPAAIAAAKRGEIDALSNVDPVMTKLEQDGDIKIIADSRTEEGTRALFGGSNPAAVLYLKQDFIEKNPNTVQALVNAFYKTLKWLEQASPGADRRDGAGGVLPRRQGALPRRGQGQQAGLFAHRCRSRRRHAIRRRHADRLRPGAQGRQDRSGEDLRRPLHQAGGGRQVMASDRARVRSLRDGSRARARTAAWHRARQASLRRTAALAMTVRLQNDDGAAHR